MTMRWSHSYAIFGMLIGACFFAFVIGTCCTLIESLDDLSVRFQAQLAMVNDYMEVLVNLYNFSYRGNNRLVKKQSFFFDFGNFRADGLNKIYTGLNLRTHAGAKTGQN